MKILITGVAGFLGSHLAEKYVEDGNIVYGIDNLINGNLNNIRTVFHKKSFKFIKEDIRNKNLGVILPQDLDAIIHLAAQIHVDRSVVNPWETYEINVMGTMNILEFARMFDTSKVLFASSSEVYGTAKYSPMNEDHPLNAQHPYGTSKIAAERLCYAYSATYGLNVSILRCFNLFGPRQQDIGYGGVISIFTKRVLNNQPPIIYGDGNQTRDYMYIEDAVQAYDCVLASNKSISEPINFGTGKEVSIKSIAEKIISMFKKERLLKPVYTDPRPIEVQRLIADTSKAKKYFDFETKFTFEEGLKKYIEWYKDYRHERWHY